MILKIYKRLLKKHGPRKRWPISGFTEPKEWEICIGAILTQNTAWRNVEKALSNLENANCKTADAAAHGQGGIVIHAVRVENAQNMVGGIYR